jgi:hypothetical protein
MLREGSGGATDRPDPPSLCRVKPDIDQARLPPTFDLASLAVRDRRGDTFSNPMRFLYFAIKFFPYWSIPLGLIFGEMGMIFRRRGNRKLRNRMFQISGFFLILTVFFFVFRWDMTLFPWIRDHFRGE